MQHIPRPPNVLLTFFIKRWLHIKHTFLTFYYGVLCTQTIPLPPLLPPLSFVLAFLFFCFTPHCLSFFFFVWACDSFVCSSLPDPFQYQQFADFPTSGNANPSAAFTGNFSGGEITVHSAGVLNLKFAQEGRYSVRVLSTSRPYMPKYDFFFWCYRVAPSFPP